MSDELQTKSAPDDRAAAGPFDESEANPVRPYIDLGGIKVLPREGLNLRLEVEEQTGRIVAVGLDYADSTLQVQPFAAPRTTGLWEETREQIRQQIRQLQSLPEDELYVAAKELQAPYELVKEVAEKGKLPVVLFTAGGIATPADAAMMMQLGAEGVFVGSGIFKSGNPAERAKAIVKATTFHDDPEMLANISRGLGEAMVGINVDDIPEPHRLAERGW